MGGCLGGAAGPHKEPEDLTLDELEFEKVKIQQFDDVFNAAAEVLNVVVDLNNDIVSTVDMMKDAVADLLGTAHVYTRARCVIPGDSIWQGRTRFT
jgi:hypothetical protein